MSYKGDTVAGSTPYVWAYGYEWTIHILRYLVRGMTQSYHTPEYVYHGTQYIAYEKTMLHELRRCPLLSVTANGIQPESSKTFPMLLVALPKYSRSTVEVEFCVLPNYDNKRDGVAKRRWQYLSLIHI